MNWIESTPLIKTDMQYTAQETERGTSLTVKLDIDKTTYMSGFNCYATVNINGNPVLGNAFDAKNIGDAKQKTEKMVENWVNEKLKTFTNLAKIIQN